MEEEEEGDWPGCLSLHLELESIYAEHGQACQRLIIEKDDGWCLFLPLMESNPLPDDNCNKRDRSGRQSY